MKTTVLETRQLNKYFYEPQKFQVLKNINLQIQAGEFVALVGKSGCGKSTLMYVLSSMDTDYQGELYIKGQKLSGQKQNALARFRNEYIGFVFQFHYLLPEFSVLQNVMLPAQKLGRYSTKEIEQRAYSKLKLLGMEDHALKPSSKLSGGQQQRVAIARALINNPAIVMGDEPTGNLDSYNTGLVLEIFQELKQVYGQTIIAVTHDDAFAQRSDRIVEMMDGSIIGSNILVS